MTRTLLYFPDLDALDPLGSGKQVSAAEVSSLLPGYAVQVMATDGGAACGVRTLEAVARRMVDRIAHRPADRPVRLVGVGQGARLALHVALELQGRDLQVDFVAVIDLPCLSHRDLPWLGDALYVLAVQTFALTAEQAMQQASAWGRVVSQQRLECIRSHGRADAMAAVAGRRASKPLMPYNPLHALQQGDSSKGTVLCLPGAGDGIARFIGLVGELGRQWTVLGLQPRGIDGFGVPHVTVQAAARAHLLALQAKEISEPIHLIAHSFGGWIAFELAGLLAAAGQPVASLTLVDTEAPDHPESCGKEYLQHEAMSRFADIVEMAAPAAFSLDRAAMSRAQPDDRLPLLHGSMVRVGMLSARTRPEVLAGPFRTFCAALRTRYSPTLLSGTPVSLVCVRDSRLTPAQNTDINDSTVRGWRLVAPDLVVWEAPGNHMTVLAEPQVQQLAQWWRQSTADVGLSMVCA